MVVIYSLVTFVRLSLVIRLRANQPNKSGILPPANCGSSHVIVGASWRLQFSPQLGKDKKKLEGIVKIVEVEISVNLIFVEHIHLQRAGASWNRGHNLRHYTYVILEEANLKEEVVLKYGVSLGCHSERSATDESEASSDVSDESEQYGDGSCSNNDPGILHWVLGMW